MEQYKGVCLSLIHIVIAGPSAAVVAAVIAIGIGCLVRERCRTTGKSFTVELTLKSYENKQFLARQINIMTNIMSLVIIINDY